MLWGVAVIVRRVSGVGRSADAQSFSCNCLSAVFSELACAMQLCFDGAQWKLQFLGDFVIRVFFEVAQFHQLSVALGQLFDGQIQILLALLLEICFVGNQSPVFNLQNLLVAIVVGHAVYRHGLQTFAANEVNAVVGGDAKQPRAEGILGVKLLEGFEGLGEGLLGQVLGILRGAYHLEAHVVNRFAVTDHQILVGLGIAIQGLANQTLVF